MLAVPAQVGRRVGDRAILRTQDSEFSWPDPTGALRPGNRAIVVLKDGGRVRVEVAENRVLVTGQRLSLILPLMRGAEIPSRGELAVEVVGPAIRDPGAFKPTADEEFTERPTVGDSTALVPRSAAGDRFVELASRITQGELR